MWESHAIFSGRTDDSNRSRTWWLPHKKEQVRSCDLRVSGIPIQTGHILCRNKQTNRCAYETHQLSKKNECGSSKIHSCFDCSLNRWYKVIYNHPIGRKNTTNIYHLYRQKSPVFSTHHWHPEVFFFQRHVFHQTLWGSPCLMASCWIVCWRWVFNGTVPNHQRRLNRPDGRNLGTWFFPRNGLPWAPTK